MKGNLLTKGEAGPWPEDPGSQARSPGERGGGGAQGTYAHACVHSWRGEILAGLFPRQVDAQGVWVEGSS